MRAKIKLVDKLKIIAEIKEGKLQKDIAKNHGVSKGLVTKLAKPAEQANVQNETRNGTQSLSRCRVRKRKFGIIETDLFEWFTARRREKKVISSRVLMRQALRINNVLKDDEVIIRDNPKLTIFKASEKWFRGFKRDYGISRRSIKGTESIVPQERVVNGRETLKNETAGYCAQDIFNVDESGLFYRQLPSRSYLQKGEVGKELAVQKERVTILLCCSYAGQKLPPMVIGKHKKPRCLRNMNIEALAHIYTASKNAWLTRKIFTDWIKERNAEFAQSNRNVCFVLDNFSGHSLTEELSHIKLVFLPPGTTSILQPLDCGIINSFKSHYGHLLSDNFIENNCSDKPSIKDALHYTTQAWEKVTEATIKNCWKKADIIWSGSDEAAEALLTLAGTNEC